MAIPTLGLLVSTSLSTCESITGFTIFDTLDTDIKKEGSNAITGTFRNDGTYGFYNAGSAPITGLDKHFRIWINTTSLPYLEVEANGGIEIGINDGTLTEYLTVAGSDTYFGGWLNVVVDVNLFTTLTAANIEQWGVRMQYTGSAKNVDNCWVDALKYLDGYSITGGTSGDPVTLATTAERDRITGTTLVGYGVMLAEEEVYFGFGQFQIGSGATATYVLVEGDVLAFADKPVATGLYELSAVGTGCELVVNNSTIKSGGSAANTRVYFDMSDTDATVSITNSVIIRGGTMVFASGQTITGNTIVDSLQITHGGATMNDTSISGYEGTADTAAMLYAVAVDPNGEMDNMSFEKGTASTHAIEFDATNTPTSITLTGIDFSGYNAANGNTDSTLYFPSTTKSYTVNLSGCTGNISYKVGSGGSVTLVSDPVTLKFTVKDGFDGSLLTGARVLAEVTSAANFPYNASINITGSGTTATVAHTTHGLATNDYVVIKGANEDVYNGQYKITVTGASEYEYTTNETIGTTPATGTITSTYAMVSGITDGVGEIEASWELSSDQPFSYRVRKSTSAPYFITSASSDTITTTADKDVAVQLTRDQ